MLSISRTVPFIFIFSRYAMWWVALALVRALFGTQPKRSKQVFGFWCWRTGDN